MIECVSIANANLFDGNPLAQQFKLRYKSLVDRQNWNLKSIDNMEFDQYDNPATTYFVWRDNNQVKGMSRLYPTIYPYMLEEVFSQLVTYEALPKSPSICEGSRFCIDKELSPLDRKRVSQELVIAHLEYGISRGIENIVGVMLPVYWKNLFINNGWEVIWLGEIMRDNEGKKIRAGRLPINKKILEQVRNKTGIFDSVLSMENDLLLTAG